jgi:hypothetical protein
MADGALLTQVVYATRCWNLSGYILLRPKLAYKTSQVHYDKSEMNSKTFREPGTMPLPVTV